MKKILCFLMVSALLCPLLYGCVNESPEPIFTAPEIAPEDREKLGQMEYAGLIFDLYNDYTCELAGPSETAKQEKILDIPEKCDDYALVRICPSAFTKTAYTRITIPEGVTDIGDYAFQKCEITEVILPKSLKTIGIECFDNCLNLEKAIFQSPVEVIPTAAFYGCEKLTELVLPEGVKTIGEEAFASLKSLKKLSLPESLEEIGPYAFWSSGTESLEITVPKNVKTVGEEAFSSVKGQVTYLNGEVAK